MSRCRPLAKLLTDHDVHTVTELQWTGIKNDDLLTKGADSFDVGLTADQNIEFQQNLAKLPRRYRRTGSGASA
jgi:hypothetical protein